MCSVMVRFLKECTGIGRDFCFTGKKEMSKDCLVSDLLNQCSLGCSHSPVHGRLSRMPLSGESPSTLGENTSLQAKHCAGAPEEEGLLIPTKSLTGIQKACKRGFCSFVCIVLLSYICVRTGSPT